MKSNNIILWTIIGISLNNGSECTSRPGAMEIKVLLFHNGFDVFDYENASYSSPYIDAGPLQSVPRIYIHIKMLLLI